jgi:histone-lysine N-methyltransferase SETMAR
MLYEFKKGSKATEATKNICEVYGEVLDAPKCRYWFRKFKSGDFSLQDAPRSGRPAVLDNDLLKAAIEEDPRLTTRELAERFNCSNSTVHEHLQALGKVNRHGVWVPHKLTIEQQMQRSSVCASLLARQKVDPFLERIVTGDEKWVLYINVTRKKQWLSPGQQPVPTPKPGLHPMKVMLCVWWDIRGVIYIELLDPNQTITADIYTQQLARLHEVLVRERPALVNRKGVILLHDNARPHVAKWTKQKIEELEWEVLPHPPYSPDIAPSDYYLFCSLQHFLDGKSFSDLEEVQAAISGFFASKPAEFFRTGIENLPQRWKTIVENDGNYIIN